MDGYKDYKIKIRPKGPIGTPWQSDTIFGHIAWMVAGTSGEESLKRFMEPFMDGDPPFIFSDGFPGELLPNPIHRFKTRAAGIDSMEEFDKNKKASKWKYLSIDNFNKARASGDTSGGFCDSDVFIITERTRAFISRNPAANPEKNTDIFPSQESYLQNIDNISIYARCKSGWMEKLEGLLADLSKTGYGKDRSTGMGAFDMEGIVSFDGFIPFDSADGFISLSSFVPDKNDPVDGLWKIRVKRGFLGENAGNGNPFKLPLIQFEPGAVFKTEGNPRPWYGRIVKNIAPGMPEAVQNCYTLAVPCKY